MAKDKEMRKILSVYLFQIFIQFKKWLEEERKHSDWAFEKSLFCEGLIRVPKGCIFKDKIAKVF